MSTKREQGMMGIQNREKRKSLFFSLLVFPSDPASLNDKLRCLQISDREQQGRGIIAGKFKRSQITTANDLYNCQFFRLGFHKGKLSYMEFLDNFQDRRSFGVGERVTEYPSHRYNVLHLLIQLHVHC